MNVQLAYLIAGLLGSALKAWATTSQDTFSKRSVIDVILGGAAAVLIPQFLPNVIPTGVSLLTQAIIVGVISYASSDLIQNMLGKYAPNIQASGGPGK